jgi:TrmH family RNA methyltransferase
LPINGPILTSIHNPHVKYARSLHVRKNRERERAFLVEGTRLFEDALDAGAVPAHVYVDLDRSGDRWNSLLVGLEAQDIPIHPCSVNVIEVIANTQTPQGIIAIFPFPDLKLEPRAEPPLVVVADGIKDPGNLGTLMRAALGAGADRFFVTSQTVDAYSPKVVRAGMGAHFRLRLDRIDWNAPPTEFLACTQRIAAEAAATKRYDEVDWRASSAVVLGSEATGISESARRYGLECVSIPLRGNLESLNAAMAGAVILFEAARQRRTQ